MANLAIDYYGGETAGGSPDFAKAKAAGAKVIMCRGAYGRRINNQVGNSPIFLDPAWSRDKRKIVEAGLRRTSYLFVCMPRKGYTTPEPEVQAEAFADYVSDLRGPSSSYAGDYPPCFDVEEQSSLSSEAYFEWILRVALSLRSRFGAWPIMYSSQRVWTEYLRNRPAGELINCPQWVAKPWPWDIRQPAHLDGAPGWNPNTIDSFGDATNWLWYQYQGDALGVPGFPSTCDLNRVQVISKGARGDIVRWIQARVGAKVDGDFGIETETKVKTFQGRFGLTQDGIVGAGTAAPLSWQTPPGC